MSVSPYCSPDVASPMQTLDIRTPPQVVCHPCAEEPMSLSTKRREPPNSSPLACRYNKKKPRTVTVRDFKCSSTQQSTLTSATRPSITLSIEHFLESEEERKERELAEANLFLNMLSTHAISSKSDGNKHLKDFKEIYTQTISVTTNLLPSTTYYMEIIDENPCR